MPAYWLVLSLCLAAADGGEVCEPRLWPWPVADCQRIAAMIMRAEPSYSLKGMRCEGKRPDVPEMQGSVPADRWA